MPRKFMPPLSRGRLSILLWKPRLTSWAADMPRLRRSPVLSLYDLLVASVLESGRGVPSWVISVAKSLQDVRFAPHFTDTLAIEVGASEQERCAQMIFPIGDDNSDRVATPLVNYLL